MAACAVGKSTTPKHKNKDVLMDSNLKFGRLLKKDIYSGMAHSAL